MVRQQDLKVFDPQLPLQPVPSLRQQAPIVSDTLIPASPAGRHDLHLRPKRVTSGWTLELQDGTVVTFIGILYCTGYRFDYSIFES